MGEVLMPETKTINAGAPSSPVMPGTSKVPAPNCHTEDGRHIHVPSWPMNYDGRYDPREALHHA